MCFKKFLVSFIAFLTYSPLVMAKETRCLEILDVIHQSYTDDIYRPYAAFCFKQGKFLYYSYRNKKIAWCRKAISSQNKRDGKYFKVTYKFPNDSSVMEVRLKSPLRGYTNVELRETDQSYRFKKLPARVMSTPKMISLQLDKAFSSKICRN